MLNEYNPDGWVLVKITGTDPHYRVFGSWRGSFLDGDSWRMNSGIVSAKLEGDHYLFKSTSGSVYSCHKKGYGELGAYAGGVLNDYVENSSGTLQCLCEMPENVLEIDWLIGDKLYDEV